jgi:O-antigen ligase
VTPSAIAGFAQNRNAFALQLLLALGGALVFLDRGRTRQFALALLFAAFWLAGSRSGWIGLICVSLAAAYFRRISLLEILSAAGLAAVIAAAPVLINYVRHLFLDGNIWASVVPDIVPESGSTAERVESLIRGWGLFVEHPFFGAGLGAFNHLDIRTGGGIPLVIHSTPLWLLAELGLFGFLVFAIPGFYVWFSQGRLADRDPSAALISLCCMGLAVMSGPADMLYQRAFWLLIGAALAVPLLQQARPEKANAPLAC